MRTPDYKALFAFERQTFVSKELLIISKTKRRTQEKRTLSALSFHSKLLLYSYRHLSRTKGKLRIKLKKELDRKIYCHEALKGESVFVTCEILASQTPSLAYKQFEVGNLLNLILNKHETRAKINRNFAQGESYPMEELEQRKTNAAKIISARVMCTQDFKEASWQRTRAHFRSFALQLRVLRRTVSRKFSQPEAESFFLAALILDQEKFMGKEHFG